jgi:alpha-1,2-mannosyltransferase
MKVRDFLDQGECPLIVFDPVFNYLEPLHLLTRAVPLPSTSASHLPFQTWEYSPVYALRSYLYLILHLPFTLLPSPLAAEDKRIQFFGLRIGLALVSSLAESWWYRFAIERVNPKVGRYMLVYMLTAAGFWEATTGRNFVVDLISQNDLVPIAVLPSSFAFYFVTLALSFSFPPLPPPPSPSVPNPQPPQEIILGIPRHIILPTILFSVAAFIGWPFAILMSLPYVIHHLWFEEENTVKVLTGFIKSAFIAVVMILVSRNHFFYEIR